MKDKIQYQSIFANLHIKPVVSEEKDKYLSMASTEQLKKFIPEIDLENNIDLLPIAFDACVVNRVNKNGDVMDSATAAKIAKNFINKPINIEHNRNTVVGCILSYAFTEFGSNNKIEEKDIDKIKGPFNITLGGLVWKIVNQDLADKIEESNDPTSMHYMSISASWELGFGDFNVIVLDENEKNIENGKFITDASEIDKIKNYLKGFGGNGKLENGKYVYRQVAGKVLPLGIGLTLNPAADVKGVAANINNLDIELKEEKASTEESDQNISSQDHKLDVKKDIIYMKISKIEQITDQLLKEVTASSITDFIADEIKKVSDQFVAEKAEKENELKNANEKISAMTSEHEGVKKQVEELNQKLSALEAEKEAKAKEEKFSMRMASLDSEYDLNEEDRKVLAKQIKDLSDEAFEDYKSSVAILLRDKSKKVLEEKAKAAQKEVSVEEVKASETPVETAKTEEVVNQAVENGTQASTNIPNSAPAAEPTVREKYAKAFDLDGFEIK